MERNEVLVPTVVKTTGNINLKEDVKKIFCDVLPSNIVENQG